MTYDPRLNAANTMGIVDGTTDADLLARPGRRVLVVDALSQRFQELLNGLVVWREIAWTGTKITTLCQQWCGGENAWLVVLAFNGLGTPMELRPGMILRLPLPDQIDAVLAQLTPTQGVLGTTIRI